jgi:hypothetical protein
MSILSHFFRHESSIVIICNWQDYRMAYQAALSRWVCKKACSVPNTELRDAVVVVGTPVCLQLHIAIRYTITNANFFIKSRQKLSKRDKF